MNTAPTRAAEEALSTYPWARDASPLDCGIFHLGTAVTYVHIASAHLVNLARLAARGDGLAVFNICESITWFLESAERHLSQIRAAYRQEPPLRDEPDKRFYPCCGSFWEDGCRCEGAGS